MDELSETEKAAALDDLVQAFCEEWWDFQGETWLVLDGSVELSPETARVLSAMFREARGKVDPEWLRMERA
jgi:hypothetical protein